MDKKYGNTGQYVFSQYSDSDNGTETSTRIPNMSGDILQNFPYLRHGTPFGSRSTAPAITSHVDSSRNFTGSNSCSNQETFPELSRPMLPSIGNLSPFQSVIGSSQVSQGVLPSVSTFASSLPQDLSLSFPTNVSSIHESEGSDNSSPFSIQSEVLYNSGTDLTSSDSSYAYQTSLPSSLPGFHHLAARASKVSQDKAELLYSSSHAAGSLLEPSVKTQPSFKQHCDNSRPESSQLSDYGLSNSSTSNPKLSDSSTSQNFYDLVNHAVKLEPVQIEHSTDVKQTQVVDASQLAADTSETVCNSRTPPKAKFYLKGKLSDRKPTHVSPRSTDTIDITYNFQNCETDEPKTPVNEMNEIGGNNESRSKDQHQAYKEPSIADIRASLDQLNKGKATHGENLTNMSGESIDRKKGNIGDLSGFSLGGDGSLHESWYSAAMKKYADFSTEEEKVSQEPCALKGGRSDPDNPFAITSPSFSESAARALMTTTNSSTATTVRISIMSIGSRKKLITNIVNSQAAHGGLVSIVNPIVDDNAELEGKTDVKTGKTSIMSKLKREAQEKNDQQEGETNSTDIDCLNIDIQIDDDQYVGEGSNKRWQCKICPKSYTTKHNLLAHILDHSSIKPHLCLVCGKYFKQLSHLNTHMLTHDQVKPYKCEQCGKGFTQISHLKRHETVHLESKPYICDICNRGFAYPSELRIHKDKHMFGKEKCTDCDQEFNTIDELKEHMTTEKHGDDLTCKLCHRVFKYPSQLRDHMMSHGGPRPFICPECGMDFMKEHHLKAHLFTHTGLRPYSCPHCNRAFNQKANMVRHMLIHEPERAFKCEICSKTFTQPQTLKAHMVIHSDKKPYSCKYCGKQFGRQHNLQGHLHMHLNSKPYVCSICQSSFTLKGNLNRHKKVKHGLIESTENMEEDAVNFLSSFSDRTRDCGSSEMELDTYSHDDQISPENKSSKKGRKSVPKKRVTKQVHRESEGDFEDNRTDNDDDSSNIISYSDEERENEKLMSKYFSLTNGEDDNIGPRRKRKGVVLFQNKDNGDAMADNENDIDNEGEADFQKETDGQNRKNNSFNSIRNGNQEGILETAGTEKRSTRKRKKKELDDDFLSDVEAIDEYTTESAKKSAKHKGATLDNIIATKFKNV